MRPGARSPEELELLLEDAFVIGDAAAVADLFDHDAVLVSGSTAGPARGRAEIASLATTMRQHGFTYLTEPRRVVQTADMTLLLAAGTVNVMRRDPRLGWLYAISLLGVRDADERDQPPRGLQ
jgi:ketosteroid isomerase-like protein